MTTDTWPTISAEMALAQIESDSELSEVHVSQPLEIRLDNREGPFLFTRVHFDGDVSIVGAHATVEIGIAGCRAKGEFTIFGEDEGSLDVELSISASIFQRNLILSHVSLFRSHMRGSAIAQNLKINTASFHRRFDISDLECRGGVLLMDRSQLGSEGSIVIGDDPSLRDQLLAHFGCGIITPPVPFGSRKQ